MLGKRSWPVRKYCGSIYLKWLQYYKDAIVCSRHIHFKKRVFSYFDFFQMKTYFLQNKYWNLKFMGPCIVNIFQYISKKMQLYTVYLYLETALHVSGGTTTHHQKRKQLYIQHLVFVTLLLLPVAIAAGSSKSVTNTRCCRHSCLRFWWWVEVPPETCRVVSTYK